MAYPKTEFIDIEVAAGEDAGWMTLWFNQPEKRNPLTAGATRELRDVFARLQDDRSIRGVTLRGRGGIFCAGGDLKSFKNEFQKKADRCDIMEMSRGAAALFDGFNSLPQVTIAMVEGAALASGVGLMCCADVVICAASAKFSMTETQIGLSPAQIAPFVIQRLGYSPARRLMLTGERFTGAQALDMGLVDFTAETPAQLSAHEMKIRRHVLRGAPGAIADTKALLIALPKLTRDVAIEAAAETFAQRFMSEEANEGIASFFERRKPGWTQ